MRSSSGGWWSSHARCAGSGSRSWRVMSSELTSGPSRDVRNGKGGWRRRRARTQTRRNASRHFERSRTQPGRDRRPSFSGRMLREGPLVLPLFGLPLRDRHGRVADLRGGVAVAVEVDVLEPDVVVALGVVRAELRPARLLALDRGDDDGLRAVEHVPQLDGSENVLVEDGAAIVDVRGPLLLLEPPHDLVRLAQAGLVAEDRTVAVHHGPELVLDLRDPAAAVALAGDDPLDRALVLVQLRAAGVRHRDAAGAARGVLARARAEDQRVEQRVRAEAVATVDRHAGHLAGGVQAGDRRPAVHVGLDAAHDVVLAGADLDRLARDVHAREVLADVHDLAQRLERALARDDRDVERDAAALGPGAAALVDLGLLGARDDVARGELHLVRRVLLHEALAVRVEEVRALAARALGDEEAVLDERRRVVLDHLHVHQRRADPVGLRDAVP